MKTSSSFPSSSARSVHVRTRSVTRSPSISTISDGLTDLRVQRRYGRFLRTLPCSAMSITVICGVADQCCISNGRGNCQVRAALRPLPTIWWSSRSRAPRTACSVSSTSFRAYSPYPRRTRSLARSRSMVMPCLRASEDVKAWCGSEEGSGAGLRAMEACFGMRGNPGPVHPHRRGHGSVRTSPPQCGGSHAPAPSADTGGLCRDPCRLCGRGRRAGPHRRAGQQSWSIRPVRGPTLLRWRPDAPPWGRSRASPPHHVLPPAAPGPMLPRSLHGTALTCGAVSHAEGAGARTRPLRRLAAAGARSQGAPCAGRPEPIRCRAGGSTHSVRSGRRGPVGVAGRRARLPSRPPRACRPPALP